MRGDLPRGLQAAQIVHASGESVRERVHEGTHAVVLVAPDEAHLEAVRKRLVLACIPHVAITEPDAPWCGALMALGVEPARKEFVRRVVSSLPLLK
ncbi:MAG: peptidyl-tRNA hydrolase [Candidatus Cryosericum sp.]